MSYSSCIRHPHFELQITIREWQVVKCKTKAAPMLLNLFEKTHTRLLHEYQRQKENGVKPEELKKLLWQNWTEDQLEKMLLGQHKRDSIRSARKELENFKFIIVGENPHGKRQDRSLWIRFLAHNVNSFVDKYVKEKYPSNPDLYLNGSTGKPTKSSGEKKPSKPDKFEADINEIFSAWQRIFDKPKTKLTESKRRKIRARLKEDYTKEFIIEACEGCKLSDWHVENIEFDIAKICRDSSNLEKHQERFSRYGKKTTINTVSITDSEKPNYQKVADFIVENVIKKGGDVSKLKTEVSDPVVKDSGYLAELCISQINQTTILDETHKNKIKNVCKQFVFS